VTLTRPQSTQQSKVKALGGRPRPQAARPRPWTARTRPNNGFRVKAKANA